jgi:hypothetical protein
MSTKEANGNVNPNGTTYHHLSPPLSSSHSTLTHPFTHTPHHPPGNGNSDERDADTIVMAADADALVMAAAADALASSIDDGIKEWGVVHHSKTGEKFYAMEV